MNFQKLRFRIQVFFWRFSRADFYRDFADAMARKVGIRDFLDRAESNARMLKDSTQQAVVRAVSLRLASGYGSTFSEMMLGIAPASDQMLLRAVDNAGSSKVEAMNMAADAVEFQLRTLKTIGYELLMPIAAIPIVAALCYINADIINTVARDAPPEVWTGFNGVARSLGELITNFWPVILAATVGSLALLVWALPRWIGPTRLKVEGWVVFSLFRDYNAAVVLSALAMMIRSGKTMKEALVELRGPAQLWLRWHLNRIITSLEDNPTDYIAAFGRGLMPPSVRARLASLRDSARSFDEALVALGSREIAALETRVKVSSTAVGYSLLMFLGTIAVVLSLGQMTIASALSRESDPTKMMQRAAARS